MTYSKFHKDKNPFSPARLDEAFKASTMEGGPDDPVKVKIDKDLDAGTVTVTKSSKGKQSKLSDKEKEAANNRWASMSEEDKQAARDRKAKREAISSFTYKTLDYEDSMPIELLPEDDMDIELAPPPEDYITQDKPTGSYTYTTSTNRGKGKGDLFDGSGIRKIQSTARNIQNRCRQGFFKKGPKCIKKGERSITKQLRRR